MSKRCQKVGGRRRIVAAVVPDALKAAGDWELEGNCSDCSRSSDCACSSYCSHFDFKRKKSQRMSSTFFYVLEK